MPAIIYLTDECRLRHRLHVASAGRLYQRQSMVDGIWRDFPIWQCPAGLLESAQNYLDWAQPALLSCEFCPATGGGCCVCSPNR